MLNLAAFYCPVILVCPPFHIKETAVCKMRPCNADIVIELASVVILRQYLLSGPLLAHLALLCKFEKELSFFQVDTAPCQSIQFGKQNVGWILGTLLLSAGFPCAIPGAAFSGSRGWVPLGIRFH